MGIQDLSIVPIDSLVTTESPRLGGVDREHVAALAECADQLPPIVVHRATMRVIDGAHRLQALRSVGRDYVDVRFFDGDEAEAFVIAVQSNVQHGLPLSLAERKAAANRILRSYPEWSDRMIASVAGLSPKTVGAIRGRSSVEIPQSEHRLGRDGRVRKVRVYVQPAIPAAAPANAGAPLGRRGSGTPNPAGSVVIPPPRLALAASLPGEVVSRLRRDPSLRFTEGGRLLLRLLDTCTLGQQQWNQMLQSMPAHHLATVVALARECATSWQSFADRLASQSDGAGLTEPSTNVTR